MDLKELEQLISLLKPNDISELELEHDGMKVKLSRGVRTVAAGTQRSVELEPAMIISEGAPRHASHDSNGAAVPARAPVGNFVEVKSPIVGTFYRRPSPDAEPFAKEGDTVSKGDTICIIEAMKLMNEIEAPCDGKIEKIMLTDSRVVEYGEILFLITPQ